MKIMIKTLKGAQFDLQAESTDTVLSVKKQIEAAQGAEAYPHSHQRLIYQGKVLKDDQTLLDNSVGEDGFMVVMVTKPKAAAPSPTPASAPAPASQIAPPSPVPAAAPLPTPSAAPPAAPAPPTTAPTPTPAAAAAIPGEGGLAASAASAVVVGSALENTVQQLLEMGGGSWSRDSVMRALRAAYNNPERAVEYLYSSIPDSDPPPPLMGNQAGAAPASAAATAPAGPNVAPLDLFPQGMPDAGEEGGGGAGEGAGPLEFLRSHPQFQALRSMVRVNPQILQPMLQELSKQNPNLMRTIRANQQAFIRLINEGGEGEGEGEGEGDAMALDITAEENEAVLRLEALGFTRHAAVEAYLACDKNEQLAANYLLETPEFED